MRPRRRSIGALLYLSAAFFPDFLPLHGKGQTGQQAAIQLIPQALSVKGSVGGNTVAWPRAKAAPAVRLPDSYVELYKLILAEYRGKPNLDFETAAALSDVAFRLWDRTHDTTYRQESLDYFNRSLSDPSFSLKDFHIMHHFGELAYRMNRENLISAERHQQLVNLVEAELEDYLKSPDDAKKPTADALFNIRIGQIAGYAGLLKFLDGERFDQREAVQLRLDAFWGELCKLGNTDEDAENYDSLGMAFAIDLGRLLGREDDLKAAGFHRYFDNFRDIVSPSGLVPEYGDSYFSYDSVPMDRVYLLEYAAHLYNDSTFLGPLRKMWDRPQEALPDEDEWIRSLALIDMGMSSNTPQPISGPPSQILYRNAPQSTQPVPDKLILRTERQPGASMIMMDLYASGSHAAKDKGPSIGYYESGQVPLFHSMGRRGTRSAIDGNIAWAVPPGEHFPGLWNQEGKWFTMTIPVEVINKNNDGKYVLSTMELRNFPESENNKDTTSLCFDNLRLVGPEGTLLVDSFDASDGWDRNLLQKTPPADSQDKTQGATSQCIAWDRVKAQVIKRTLPAPWPTPFTKQQFCALKLDVKYRGTRPYMLVRGFGDEIELGAQVLRPTLKSAMVTQRGQDALGQVSYEKYIQDDTTLTRQIVLTSEGYLIVQDTLMPGPSMNGWTAGQLWQIYTLGKQGDGWFSSDDDGTYPNVSQDRAANPTRSMLVRYAISGATSAQDDQAKQDYTYPNPKGRAGQTFFTTYSQRTVRAGHAEIFSMVVVPYDPGHTSLKELAKSVAMNQSPDGASEATVTMGSKTVVVRIGDTEWSVERRMQ